MSDLTDYFLDLTFCRTNMVAYTLELCFAKWACDRLTEDADFDKKKSSFQMMLILILAGI